MQTMKTVSAVVALLVLLVSLGLSGCANQTKSETGALLTQDYRKMDNDELTLYYYRLTEEIDRAERSGSGSAISIGIGGGSWGWGSGGRRRRGHLHNNPRGRRRRHGRFTQPPRRGPGGDAAPEHESYPEVRVQGKGQRVQKMRRGKIALRSSLFLSSFLPVP